MEHKAAPSLQRDNRSDMQELALLIKEWGQALGFQQVGIADIDLSEAESHLLSWLDEGLHGEMDYMSRHGTRRSRPETLVNNTLRVISLRMDYLPPERSAITTVLNHSTRGYVSRYALGRDYHKMLRKRLQQLAFRIEQAIGQFGYRAFVDSAPVLEKALGQKAGLGWIGKHTNLINHQAGSWFFLGELYTDLPLPIDKEASNHCGKCTACIDICPTAAIIAPYRLDARLCISYLTIELEGTIPEKLRPLIGNRIYGCDDCQLVCPWNRFARYTAEPDFHPRQHLDNPALVDLFAWSEEEFLRYTEGSAIRRIGHVRWLRNIAVALGNALAKIKNNITVKYQPPPVTKKHPENRPDKQHNSGHLLAALSTRIDHPSSIVREHVQWAIEQHKEN